MNCKVEGKLDSGRGVEASSVAVLIVQLRNNEGLSWNFLIRMDRKLKTQVILLKKN